ncbi:MAG: bifunctional acetate--CoA ligase family protein/GNAT family N-acetyltransferase [Candidatus Diapherotrites archaeon]
MNQEQLKKLFNPQSIAVIGASNTPGSVGLALMKNLVGSGFEGTIFPVNPKRKNVMGIHCYKSVQEIPETPEMAIIAIPAIAVPSIVKECIAKGTKAFVVLSAGFGEIGEDGKKIELELKKIIDENNCALLGPNCLGFIRPDIKLNASFATRNALPGKIALISQSGALCSGILDWALKQEVGFKYFISVGAMIDIGFSDLIDFFSSDPEVQCIVMYVETIKNARKFMSAARAFSRSRPIIVAKSGKYGESAKAAISHTGSMAGNSEVFDAAFKRAGIIRVDTILDMFNCSEALAKLPLPKGNRLAVVTNAGGPGVMAADAIIENKCRLAKLSPKAMAELEKEMPMHWSRNNPVDILGDSLPPRYGKALEIIAREEEVDGIIVIFAPQAISEPLETAKTVIEVCKKYNKPVLAAWMGESFVDEAREYFRKNNVPDYSTPEEAVKVFSYLYSYSENRKLLYETPKEIPLKVKKDSALIKKIISSYKKNHIPVMNENDSKKILAQYGLPVNETLFAKTAKEAVKNAKKIGFPVAMKISSKKITHKTDVGGIELNLLTESAVIKAFHGLKKRVKEKTGISIEGVSIQQMVKSTGPEVIIGASRDPIFGSIILFGAGGISVELYKDKAIALPPLDQTLAKNLIEETKVSKMLKGFRGKPPVNMPELERILVHFSKLVVDYPEIKEVDLNPVIPSEDKLFVVDARIVLDLEFEKTEQNKFSHLAIMPYPEHLTKEVRLLNGAKVKLRAIMPEDEPRHLAMLRKFSPKTVRQRFFHMVRDWDHEALIRYCFNDYDREIAIVAERGKGEQRELLGVVRIMSDPGKNTAEFAIVVTDEWQRKGLGTIMLRYIMDIARQKGLSKIWGHVLVDNAELVSILHKEKFSFSTSEDKGVYYVEKPL